MGDILLPRGKGAACRKLDKGSRSGVLAPSVYYSWDGDDELFFSESRTTLMPGNYMFDNIFHGYESGALLYKNLTAGTVENDNPVLESLIYEVKYYTYLNGLKVGFSEVQTPYAPSYFYVYDGQGNVVQISNRAGDLPYNLYKYSSYGEKISLGGTGSEEHGTYKGYDEGPFGFKTGVRNYDPQTGRFLQPDAFKGYLSEPASQNPYMYCRGNPIKYSDPTGYNEGFSSQSVTAQGRQNRVLSSEEAEKIFKGAEDTAGGIIDAIIMVVLPEAAAAIKTGQLHHICTNKNWIRGGKFSEKFAEMFKRAGLSFENIINKVMLKGHKGSHAAENERVYERLKRATEGIENDKIYGDVFEKELNSIKQELIDTPEVFRGSK
jgi:RHS repeat-associated protein